MNKQSSQRRPCSSAGRVTAKLLLSFLAASSIPVVASWTDAWANAAKQAPIIPLLPPSVPEDLGNEIPPKSPGSHEFKLRHIFHHGTYLHPDLHRRINVDSKREVWTESEDGGMEKDVVELRIMSTYMNIQRLADRRIAAIGPLLAAARLGGKPPTLPPSAWTMDEVLGPNVRDKETVINLAIMAANAYDPGPGEGEWEDVGCGFNYSDSFGWHRDGLRGHVYADEDNSTIVIGLKGTSPAVFDGKETTTNDKENDNLFFSCCCGQGGQYLWRKPCDCMSSAFTCNQTCLFQSLKRENRYYSAAVELYGNVTELYPRSNIWLTGHSLGGSVSSLLGQTFGIPVLTFEAPGDALPASRLGLPSPPGSDSGSPQRRRDTGIFHIGHTADPIFMGSCNGATSPCTLAGFAMESQCHTGEVSIYDVVKDLSWRVSVRYHSIRPVLENIIKQYDDVPAYSPDSECVDCFNWKFFHSNGSDRTTTSSSSSSSSTTKSYTRTETCRTPGWWGCQDKTTTRTTTTSTSTSTSTSSSTTATCSTYGWFGGCLDKTSTTSTSHPTVTTTVPRVTSATHSCENPGFFGGCKDPTTTSTSTETCLTPGMIYGCRDKTTAQHAHTITEAPSLP